jgi:hypothetical protein
MKGSFKFFKQQNGTSAFAEIAVKSAPSSDFSVRWTNDRANYERNYGGAVWEGIVQALRWHRDLGGGSAEFTILEFIELVVDTKADAIKCASAAAAWKALGHSETELTFNFDGTWHVTLKRCQS